MAVLHREIFPWNPTWRLRDSGNGRTVRNILEALPGGMLGLDYFIYFEMSSDQNLGWLGIIINH